MWAAAPTRRGARKNRSRLQMSTSLPGETVSAGHWAAKQPRQQPSSSMSPHCHIFPRCVALRPLLEGSFTPLPLATKRLHLRSIGNRFHVGKMLSALPWASCALLLPPAAVQRRHGTALGSARPHVPASMLLRPEDPGKLQREIQLQLLQQKVSQSATDSVLTRPKPPLVPPKRSAARRVPAGLRRGPR